MRRRARWKAHGLLLGLHLFCWVCVAAVDADCWYNGSIYKESADISTSEPCLKCICVRSALVCHLRVCPRLPHPPPRGCFLLHRRAACCTELICTELSGGSSLEARSDPDQLEIAYDETFLRNACTVNGTIYAPGSAMGSSTQCEYCYCLGGHETCIRPQCLHPVEGCIPQYDHSSCCPVGYECSRIEVTTKTATTISIKTEERVDGCVSEDGGRVADGSKLALPSRPCDSCYCVRGRARCEPLACAPPLRGCEPLLRPGQCCAASYNCSGAAIEAQPADAGGWPTVSKEYAKLRKEVYQTPQPVKNVSQKGVVTILAESMQSFTTNKIYQRKPDTYGTTRHFTGMPINHSTSKSLLQNYVKDVDKMSTTFPGMQYATVTKYDFYNTANQNSTTTAESNSKEKQTYMANIIIKPPSKEKKNSNENTISTQFYISETETTTNVIVAHSHADLEENSTEMDRTTDTATSPEIGTSTFSDTTTSKETVNPITSVIKSTDCIDENLLDSEQLDSVELTTLIPLNQNQIHGLEVTDDVDNFTTTRLENVFTETSTIPNIYENKIKASDTTAPNTPINLNSSNIKKQEEYDDYEYNESSLPPSLPNLKIIPFVAADALEPKIDSSEKNSEVLQKDVIDDRFDYSANLFSPPVKTEGGFVPKDPLTPANFYENAVTIPALNGAPKTKALICVTVSGQEILHGSIVPSESACGTCMCFYGSIICQKATCLRPGFNCEKSDTVDICCSNYICNSAVPPSEDILKFTEAADTAKKAVSPNPYKEEDMITQPNSFIDELVPYLHTTSPMSETTSLMKSDSMKYKGSKEVAEDVDVELSLMSTLMTKTEYSSLRTTTKPIFSTTTDNIVQSHPNSVDEAGVAALKLAGCNIYGRMYRVGRIILELSGPCLECKCTEVGVQCMDLKC